MAPDTTTPDPVTAALPAIERPNGKLYRPRKVSARILVDEDGIESSVLVTGTHDIERALPLARVVARQHVSADCEPADPHQGWWRQVIRNHDPFWEWDEVRGARPGSCSRYPMTDDKAAARLAEIEERWSKAEYVGLKDWVVPEPGPQPRYLPDIPRLIAAVRAGLAHHYIEPGIFPPQCTTCRVWDDVLEEYVGVIAPCPTQAAMTRALLGEEGT